MTLLGTVCRACYDPSWDMAASIVELTRMASIANISRATAGMANADVANASRANASTADASVANAGMAKPVWPEANAGMADGVPPWTLES